jgi:hypothetical protein
MAKKPTTTEISETKIRQAIWMLKTNKTKKSICEHLGIAYNTKRLDTIVKDFQDREERVAELKKKRSKTPFSEAEKINIVKDYNDGDSQSAIAERLYTTPARIKSVLIEMNVPLRARSKKGEATVDHVVQDLDIILKKGDRVFVPKVNSFGTIKEVFDEDWIDYYRQPTKRRYVEIQNLDKLRKKYGEDYEGVEDTHWNIYWMYDNGTEWKEFAIKEKIKDVETILEKTGREYYSIWIEGDYGHFTVANRDKVFPVMSN